MPDSDLTIGEVARRAGLKTSAIRYYESRGLLPEPERVAGHRRYGYDTLRRLRVIDVAKRAVFSLDEARVLLTDGDGEHLRALAERKLSEVEDLIARAQAMRAWLVTASGCRCDTLDVCALFDADATAAPGLRITRVGG
jgi:MerR family redox-sensitive transcriptional activator SoxR